LKEKKLLIVDDITDTGKSLITSLEYLKKFNARDLRVAAMQYIPESKFKPDYFAEEIKVWTWFIYPWNWIEDTSTLIVRLMAAKKEKYWTLADIQKGLKNQFEIEWNGNMLKRIFKCTGNEFASCLRALGQYPLTDSESLACHPETWFYSIFNRDSSLWGYHY
jgi:hypoxanthine phosphoribosyltransferase